MAKKKPFHMHALDKASATHLLKQGHISKRKHAEIVSGADKNMQKMRAANPAPAPMQAPVQKQKPGIINPAPMPSDMDGDEGM